MKKSQVLSALALTYIAGSSIAPLGNIYAEAVQENCAPSTPTEMLTVISGEEIDGILARIKAMPLYQAYQTAYNLRTTYTNAEAARIDTAVTDAQATADAATTALDSAEATVAGINLNDIATKIRQLGGGTITIEAETTASDVMSAVHENLPLYDLYVNAIRAAESYKLQDIQTAVATLAEADENLTIDTDAVANANKANVASQAVTSDATVKKYRSIYREELKVSARDAAQNEKNTADQTLASTKAEQQAVIDQIVAALEVLQEQGVTINVAIRPRATVDQTIRLIKNANIDQYTDWTGLIDYVESTHGWADVMYNETLAGNINTELRKVVSDEDVIYDIFNPVALRKVCSADGQVSIEGKLPVHKLVIKTELIANLTDAIFADAIQVVYDITIEYKGAAYDNAKLEGDYKVTINVPAEMDGSKATVYYVNGDSRMVQSSTYDAENNTITFQASHFSHYAIVGPINYGGNDSTDDGFNVTPDVDTTDHKAPVISTPNTGAATAGQTNATVSVVAGFIAAASTVTALVARLARRRQA